MPGAELHPSVIKKILELRAQRNNLGKRMTLDEIEAQLVSEWSSFDKKERQGRSSPPHKNSINKYTKKYSAPAEIDLPIEWTQLGDYGIPWEASSHLLALWKRVTYKPDRKLGLIQGPLNPHPTGRAVKWWWRVMCAAQGADDEIVMYLAEDFAHRERLAEIQPTEKVIYGDLWAFISFRPWESVDAYGEYLSALAYDKERPTVDYGGEIEIRDGMVFGTWTHDPIAVVYGATPGLIEHLKWKYIETGEISVKWNESDTESMDENLSPRSRAKVEEIRAQGRRRSEEYFKGVGESVEQDAIGETDDAQ